MLKGKKVLITGGTGSLGTALTHRLLKEDVSIVRIYSRDEWKQTQMQEKIPDKRLRFLIGDIREKDRLSRAMEDIDIVFHTAALKHVPVAEYNPFEAIKTNVFGTQNVIESCLDNEVKMALAIGTDKAVSPLNTYGATKLLMERMFTAANFYKGAHKTDFLCVRYGNVLGSRGSVVPKFIEQMQNGGKITITDPRMTRFNITMKQAVDLIFRAIKNGKDGEVFIPKLKAYTVDELKNAIIEIAGKKIQVQKIPIRPGEKFHETLINKDEIAYTFESKDDYIIRSPGVETLSDVKSRNLKKVKFTESYSSDKVQLISKQELKNIILKEKLL
jgi:UDP-N-acetylglucosamine 4,6-dehydratase/UDP-glucose 4-epimerase